MSNSSELYQTGPEVMPEQIQRAGVLVQQGELIAAEALYHKLLQEKPGYPLALYGLAQLAGIIDDLEVKEVLLNQAIEQLMVNAKPVQNALAAAWLTELADMLFKLNRANEAQECLKQCERLIIQNLTHPT